MSVYDRGKGPAESMFGSEVNRPKQQMRNVFIAISLAGLSIYGLSKLQKRTDR